ncbi:MAG: hypothetical protein ACPGUC_10560 [Gammaproteobacteria bacterium]
MSALELAYERGSMFGRDLFHFGVSGFAYCAALAAMFHSEWPPNDRIIEILPSLEGFWISSLVAVLGALSLYLIGHLVFVFGLGIRFLWKLCLDCLPHVRNVKTLEEELEKPCDDCRGNGSPPPHKHNAHVAAEMDCARRHSYLYERFVARADTLSYQRLSLSAAIIAAALTALLLHWMKDWKMDFLLFVAALFAGSALMYQHFVTRYGFLLRVCRCREIETENPSNSDSGKT